MNYMTERDIRMLRAYRQVLAMAYLLLVERCLRQNPDGTAAVGPKGGTIYGPGGIVAAIPEGAFDEAISIQITMMPEEVVKDVVMHPELVSGGVFKLDTGGVTANKEIKVSIPAPAWITPDHQVLLTKVVNVRGFDELTLTCPAVLQDGKLNSTSPPFEGIYEGGLYGFKSWIDPTKGTAYVLVDTWITRYQSYIMGDYDFIFPIPSLQKKEIVVTIPINRPYNLNLQSLEGEIVKTVPVQGPPARGEFATGIPFITDDTLPPTVFISSIQDGSEGVLLIENIVLEMSEEIHPDSINQALNPDAVVVTDSNGNRVEGTFYLAADGKTIVFIPKYGYDYGMTYTITLNGVKDMGGNAITGYSSTFKTFLPHILGSVQMPGALDIVKYKNYIAVNSWDYARAVFSTPPSLITVIDVTAPAEPVKKGETLLYRTIFDIEAIPDMTLPGHDGNDYSGDYIVAAGFFQYGSSKSKKGVLTLVNVTDPLAPHTIMNEDLYLSWNPASGETPPANVPYDYGEPEDVVLLGTNAYVANWGIGVQAVDLTQVTPPQVEAQANAIGGTFVNNPNFFISVSKARTNILALKPDTLVILSPQLTQLGQLQGLNSAFSVTGVDAFLIDKPMTADQETVDLAIISTTDGIVVVNVTEPAKPDIIAQIPIKVGKIVVNKAKRLAYASDGTDLYAISLRKPEGIGFIDQNKDLKDDRVIAKLPGYGFTNAVIDTDELGRELLYCTNYSKGLVYVLDLNEPRPQFKIVAYENPEKRMIGAVTDGASKLRLQLIVPKGSQPLYSNLAWRIADPQFPNNPQPNRGTLLDAAGNPVDMVPVSFNADGVAEAVYQSPNNFVRWGTSEEKSDKERRERRISIVLSKDPLKGSKLLDHILLKRPPVVLVHGLWGNASVWNEFASKFNEKNIYEVFRVDYSEDGLVSSVATHSKALKAEIKNSLKTIRDKGIAATEVDVIAHSMGGLLTRQYCVDYKIDCQTKLRRFITIATPHLGSELADLLLVYRDQRHFFPNNPYISLPIPIPISCQTRVGILVRGERGIDPHPIEPVGGAIDDLATGQLPEFLSGITKKGRWSTYPRLAEMMRAHTIVGDMPEPFDGIAFDIESLWKYVLIPCGFTRGNVFGTGLPNDRIVRGSSQQELLSGNKTTLVNWADHFSVRNLSQTSDKIKRLIDEPVGYGSFENE